MTSRRLVWLVLILLLGATVRLAAITEIPPGLTHDEADHGVDAWGVVQGERPIYFTVGYGREPLYDYSTAVLMRFLGPTYLAGRLTAVFFSLLLLAGNYLWLSRSFGWRVALLTCAGLALSFWPLMTARQALRSGTFPTLFALSIGCFWLGWQEKRWSWLWFVIGGVLLGATIYTYIPSRVLWLCFPLVLLYITFSRRSVPIEVGQGVLLMLLVAGVIAAPLLQYLAENPQAEARIGQLSQPLEAAQAGDWQPLWANVQAGLATLTFSGDTAWRYNIPGRPFLSPWLSPFFYLGLGLALWYTGRGLWPRSTAMAEDIKRGAASFLALIWFLLGLAPILITGPELSTTQAIGLQPVLYLFPALALLFVGQQLAERWQPGKVVAIVFAAILFLLVGGQSVRDYFGVWANAPQVRVQYESTLVTAIRHLNRVGQGEVAISTTTPGQFHSPAVAFLLLDNPEVRLHWFNGLSSLLIPDGESTALLFSGFAPLHEGLEPYFNGRLQTTLPLRPDDLDRPLTIYQVDEQPAWSTYFQTEVIQPAGLVAPLSFNGLLTFVGHDLQTVTVAPGETIRLATLWEVEATTEEELNLFTQVLTEEGQVLSQQDRLDVPSTSWIAGDRFVQLHEIVVPEGTAVGHYPLLIGLYNQATLQRLSVIVGGTPISDHLRIGQVEVR